MVGINYGRISKDFVTLFGLSFFLALLLSLLRSASLCVSMAWNMTRLFLFPEAAASGKSAGRGRRPPPPLLTGVEFIEEAADNGGEAGAWPFLMFLDIVRYFHRVRVF